MEKADFDKFKEDLVDKSSLKWKIKGFTKLPNSILFDNKVSKSGLLVFWALSMHLFKNVYVFPSISKLQEETKLSRSSVIAGTKNLETVNYIKIQRHCGKANRYYLKQPP